MQFNSLLFLLIYMPIFVFSMLLIKNNKVRNTMIIIFSLLFYLLNDSKYFVLLLLIILLCFLFARKVKNNKVLYALYLVIVILLLSFFKYGSYLFNSIKEMNLLMPLGISYFLFESILYVGDCYYGKYECSNNILEVASYLSFFPCISSGPILRFDKFDVYYKNNKIINYDSIADGFRRFILGLAKKVIIADQIGYLVNVVYDETTILTTPLAWLGAICFAVQLYYDFSGYSDMAIGIGQMIGFRIDENFNYPFISRSTSEFWRRWHISLGSWFRDYVYIPLGGNRVNKPRLIINIMIVWILTGIWHGSTINYVLWGFILGVCLLFEKLTKVKYPKYLGILITDFVFVVVMMLFKTNSIDSAITFYKNMFTWTGINYSYYKLLGILYLWPVILLSLAFIIPNTINLIKKKNVVLDAFVIICLCLSLIYIVGGTQLTFAYFGF